MDKFLIYTDGSSKGNPGPGGWGAIVVSSEQIVVRIKEIGGREEETTNNRMEMRAAIEGLKNIPPFDNAQDEEVEVVIYTDSEYLMKGATVWIKNWQKNNWRTKDKKIVLNQDLWQELLAEMKKRKVSWQKVLGHSGHEFNERCDEIATSFADNKKVDLYQGPKENYKFHE